MLNPQKTFSIGLFIFITVAFLDIPVFAQTLPSSNPPAISGVVADNITQSSALISWTTDVPATTRLDYGSTGAYEINSIIEPSLRTFHQIQVLPLDTDTTYHYRVRSTDASGRERVGTDNTFTTKPPLDYMPPAEITSLHVASATVTSLVLTWIAPGDDGSIGTSSSYEIRASYTTIPDIGALQWWNSANVLLGPPKPNGPGSKESYTAQNLATSTQYYFAVRARDKAGNISPISISGIKSGTTLVAPPPTITVVSVSTSSPATSTSVTIATSTPGIPVPSAVGGPVPVLPSPVVPTPTASTVLLWSSTRSLSYGMRNQDVKTLQRILIAKGLLKKGSDSGFFNLLTQAAVRKFQCAQKIVCSGSARTTGYGAVGAKTRHALSNG
ncbi:MAG: fibronectin type III domain-containing protein [Candidatus Sungbacteria bacterium]|nr:fibronectin type III domain-containing protein [Candidatus Sungbacteria bacterium]